MTQMVYRREIPFYGGPLDGKTLECGMDYKAPDKWVTSEDSKGVYYYDDKIDGMMWHDEW